MVIGRHLAHNGSRSRRRFWASCLAVGLFAISYVTLLHNVLRPALSPKSVAALGTIARCTPLSFGEPSELLLDDAPTGLTIRIDATTYYRVYGANASQLEQQIKQCAPGGNPDAAAEFTGVTNYSLTWSYAYTSLTNGNCQLSDVKVGLHTATALPEWQPLAASTRLANEWQAFIKALAMHEQYHVGLDRLYAAQLTADLTNLAPMSCGRLASAAQSLVQADITTLNQANTDYDTQTDHGATQGAILPVD